MSINTKRKQAAIEEFKKPVTKFTSIDLSKSSFIPKGLTRAYRNTRFTVMVYDNTPTSHGNAIRVMIQKHDDTPLAKHWSQIQSIKNEIFGEEVTAVEYYPKVSELVDAHNIYWIWIFPEGVLPIPSNENH